MNKTTFETIMAGAIGVVIGVLSASVFWSLRSNTISLSKTETPISKAVQKTEENIKKTPVFLTIDKPVNQSIISENTVLVSGKTNKGNVIIVSIGDTDETIFSENGEFKKEITLKEGINFINVSAIDMNGPSTKQNIQVVYETE